MRKLPKTAAAGTMAAAAVMAAGGTVEEEEEITGGSPIRHVPGWTMTSRTGAGVSAQKVTRRIRIMGRTAGNALIGNGIITAEAEMTGDGTILSAVHPIMLQTGHPGSNERSCIFGIVETGRAD